MEKFSNKLFVSDIEMALSRHGGAMRMAVERLLEQVGLEIARRFPGNGSWVIESERSINRDPENRRHIVRHDIAMRLLNEPITLPGKTLDTTPLLMAIDALRGDQREIAEACITQFLAEWERAKLNNFPNWEDIAR